MTMIIPLSSLATASQFAPTAANCPALKHLIAAPTVDLAAGACYFTDSVGGVILGSSTATATTQGDGTVLLSGNLTTKSGNLWAVPGNKYVLLMHFGKFNSTGGGLTIGASTGITTNGFKLACTAAGTSSMAESASSQFIAATADANAAGSGNTVAQAYATLFDFNHATLAIQPFKFDGTTMTTLTAGGDSTTINGLGAIDDAGSIVSSSGTSKFSMAVVMHFTVKPTVEEVKTALAWMHYNTLIDSRYNKTIWPGFAGRS